MKNRADTTMMVAAEMEEKIRRKKRYGCLRENISLARFPVPVYRLKTLY
jgi:hypothetical protein